MVKDKCCLCNSFKQTVYFLCFAFAFVYFLFALFVCLFVFVFGFVIVLLFRLSVCLFWGIFCFVLFLFGCCHYSPFHLFALFVILSQMWYGMRFVFMGVRIRVLFQVWNLNSAHGVGVMFPMIKFIFKWSWSKIIKRSICPLRPGLKHALWLPNMVIRTSDQSVKLCQD